MSILTPMYFPKGWPVYIKTQFAMLQIKLQNLAKRRGLLY